MRLFCAFLIFFATGWTAFAAVQEADAIEQLRAASELEPQDVEARRVLGLAYLQNGEVSAAIDQFEAAIGLSPLEERLHLVLTDTYWMLGLTSEAEAAAVRAVRLIPDSQRAHHTLAELYANSGRVRASLGEYMRARELEGPVPPEEIYQKIGDGQTLLVEFDEAESAYLQALDVDPGHVPSRLGLGYVYLRSGRFAEALGEYESVLRAHPDNVTARVRLAEVHLRLERFGESVRTAGEVLGIDPGNQGALYIRGTALLRMGQKAQGEADLEEFRRLETAAAAEEHLEMEVVSFNREAVAMVRQGRYQEAVDTLQEGIEARPDARSLYLNLGLIRSQLGDHHGAVETFVAMLRLGLGDDPAVHRNLAREYALLGDIEASRRHQMILLDEFGLAR